MENAGCRIHANHNEYGIGSSRLGMVYATSIWYANYIGMVYAIGMLAWGMQSAGIMPTFQTIGESPIVGMGNAGSNSYAKTSSGLGSLPILAWVLLYAEPLLLARLLLPANSVPKKVSIWCILCFTQARKYSIMGGWNLIKWGGVHQNSFSKFFKISPIWIFLGQRGYGFKFQIPKTQKFFFRNFLEFPL